MNTFARRCAWIGFAASGLLIAGFSFARPIARKMPGDWTLKAPLPTKRFEVGVAALGGKLYVLGGESNGKPATILNTVYDPATNRWSELSPIPRETSHSGVAASKDKIYALGGFSGVSHAGAMDAAYEYDVAANTWRTLAPLSSPRGSVGAAVVGGKVHAIGGRGLDKVTVNTHEVYDPATGKWSKAAPLPKARDHAGVIAVDGKIHVIGGRTAGNTDLVKLHDVYDPKTDSWKSAAPLPTARSGGAVVYYHGLILYVGGECRIPKASGGDGFVENEAYDPKTDKWQVFLAMPEQRNGFGAGAIGQQAYFAGGSIGCGGAPTSDKLFVFNLP
jgi:N-acetylneuraminic acid mutarotase